jgi:hypothetical protein
VLRDLAVLLADGGDCLSDLAALRDQAELFGPVASTATAWRVVEHIAGDDLGLASLRAARAEARARAWRVGAWPDNDLLLVDVDGTLLDAHSDKQGAAGTYKGGFGFYPLLAYLDRGDGTGEALAGLLRPGNAGSNTAQDHLEVLDLALAQLPKAAWDQPILVRADTAGATHGFTDHLRQRGIRFSISLPADERVRQAVLAVPDAAWMPATDADGQPRSGAEVAELHALDLAGWPPGTRAVCRREDPHPGAQLSFTDADGHRFQVFITDQPDPDLARLELRHRRRARVEDRIRGAKATGLRNLPFDRWRRNAVWLELVLMAQDLTCWAQTLLLSGELRVAEPKTLRYRLWHTAARVSATPAPSSCACSAPGHGRPSWRPRSRDCGRCRCAADAAPMSARCPVGSPGLAGVPAGAAIAHLATARGNNDHAQPANPALVGSQHIAADPPLRPRRAPPALHEKPRLGPAPL